MKVDSTNFIEVSPQMPEEVALKLVTDTVQHILGGGVLVDLLKISTTRYRVILYNMV
jgi:hypothetical protein